MLQPKQYAFLIFFSFILLLATSCAELDSHSKISRFNDSENIYKSSLRWGNWMNIFQLQKHQENSDKPAFEAVSEKYLEHLAHIQVTHIENLTSYIDKDGNTAKTIFLIEYHYDDSVKIKKLRHSIDWWHHRENNIWYTSTSLPEEFTISKQKPKTFKLSP